MRNKELYLMPCQNCQLILSPLVKYEFLIVGRFFRTPFLWTYLFRVGVKPSVLVWKVCLVVVDKCLVDSLCAAGSWIIAAEVPVAWTCRTGFVQSLQTLIDDVDFGCYAVGAQKFRHFL